MFTRKKTDLSHSRNLHGVNNKYFLQNPWNYALTVLIFLVTVVQSTQHIAVRASYNSQTITIIEPDLSDFPTVRHTFKVLDANQQRVSGLEATQFQIFENDISIPVESLSEIYSGIHTILAINADRDLDRRDETGVSVYDKMLASFMQWQSTLQGKDKDLWSLLVNQGRLNIRLNDQEIWLSAIENYQPDMRNSEGNLTSLKAAIDSAALSDTEMDQVLLYFTPTPQDDQLEELLTLTQHAADKNIHVHIWMVGRESVLFTEIGKALLNMAQKTEGSYFIYDGNQPIPDPTQYFLDLGSKYVLSYKSKINASGTHIATIALDLNGELITTEELSFYVDVEPPVPIFIEPPMAIEHKVLVEKGIKTALESPSIKEIEVALEFPDEHPRALNYMQLYVNDQLIQENREPPYGIFSWDYSNITEDTISVLQIKLEDELGLEVTSAQIPIEVIIIEILPEPEEIEFLKSPWLLPVILSTATLAVLAFAIARITNNKQKNASQIQQGPKSRMMISPKKTRSGLLNKLPAYAILERLALDGETVKEKSIIIKGPLTVFGSNPILSNVRLNDPSVEGIHARLRLLSNGKFILSDMGSSAGTWLNNSPISDAGTPLADGDIIKIGRIAFRISIKFKSTNQET